jgi:phosphoribosylaminoimidazole-succinocarboxamide synthase
MVSVLFFACVFVIKIYSVLFNLKDLMKMHEISDGDIRDQIPRCLQETDFPTLGKKYRGKVRDNYDNSKGERTIVVTDRISAFDRVLGTLPFKGQILNEIAKFWFENTADIMENHVIAHPDPNVVVARLCKPFPVYKNGCRNFCGNKLPDGMRKDQQFDGPIITPSTKAVDGEHDESISPAEIFERKLLTEAEYEEMAAAAMKLFNRGVDVCAKQGVILVDTKYEFGRSPDGKMKLIDEIHTPDSSRFWMADKYEERFAAGTDQKSFDKEYVRKWLQKEHNFTGKEEIPAFPPEVVVEAVRRYIEAFEMITGQKFLSSVGSVLDRVRGNLGWYLYFGK